MDFKLRWIERIPSTNTFLKELILMEPNTPSGTVIAAREQLQGRGRRDREWQAAPNESLTFSIFFRPEKKSCPVPSASMAAALAVRALLKEEGICADLKWPNDVLVNGKKICGILSEGVSGGIVIGIGLNVNMHSAKHIDQPATSMLIETGRRRDLDELLKKLLTHLESWLTRWEQGGFPEIRKDWESGIPNIGKEVTVRDGDSFRSGILQGFGDSGELLLNEQGTVSSIWAGDLAAQ
jgi:BirA family biotin operon repressor/biotin-[acetyl-CoA-carboxylase] ligase